MTRAGADPAHFGSLGSAALRLFQVVTLEGWVDVMRIQLEAGRSVAPTVLYLGSFILLGTMGGRSRRAALPAGGS